MSEPSPLPPPASPRLTPEDITRIDAALEACKGNRRAAALALKVDVNRIYNACKENPVLRAKWCVNLAEPVQPGAVADLNREPPVVFDQSDDKVVAALDRQDKIVAKKGVKLPGFDAKQQRFFAALMSTYAGAYKTAADFTHSGAVHAAGRLVVQMEEINDKLKDIEENPDKYERTSTTEFGTTILANAADYFATYSDLLIKTADALRKMNSSVLASNELRLRIDKLKQDQNKAVPKAAPAWNTPAAKAKIVDAPSP